VTDYSDLEPRDKYTHVYLSTACWHGLCDENADACRQVCKFCPSRCVHACHESQAEQAVADAELDTAERSSGAHTRRSQPAHVKITCARCRVASFEYDGIEGPWELLGEMPPHWLLILPNGPALCAACNPSLTAPRPPQTPLAQAPAPPGCPPPPT